MKYTLYHGTKRDAARQILQDKEYNRQYKDIHYLGQGIYFYDKPKKAENWIRIYYENFGTILQSIVSVEDGYIFDLRRADHRKKASSIVRKIRDTKVLMKSDSSDIECMKRKRCFLFDYISEHEKCKLLISLVSTNLDLWELGVPEKGDLQYCVKDVSIIKETSYYRDVPVRQIV